MTTPCYFRFSICIVAFCSLVFSSCLKYQAAVTSDTRDRTAQGISEFGDRRIFIWAALPRNNSKNRMCWYKTVVPAALTAPFEKLVRALPKVPLSGTDGLKPPDDRGSFLASGGPVSQTDFEAAIKNEAGAAATMVIGATILSGLKSCLTMLVPVPVAVKVWSGAFCVVEIGATGALIYNRNAKVETSRQVIVEGSIYEQMTAEQFSILNRSIAGLRLKTFESMHNNSSYNATYSKEYIAQKNLCYGPDEIIQ